MTDNKNPDAQINLPLCQSPPADLPPEKQSELAAALANLLWNAAVASDSTADRPTGGKA